MATTVALIGLHYLPYRHTFNVNITPHACERLGAYIACALLACLAWILKVTLQLQLEVFKEGHFKTLKV